MSAYAGALRPNRYPRRANGVVHGALHTAVEVFRVVIELVAFSYRLRTAVNAVGRVPLAAR
jgi:hypothetical protein